jgi:hypothetical protein
MDGHSASAIGSNSVSFTHSDSVSTQNPSSTLPPKPKNLSKHQWFGNILPG